MTWHYSRQQSIRLKDSNSFLSNLSGSHDGTEDFSGKHRVIKDLSKGRRVIKGACRRHCGGVVEICKISAIAVSFGRLSGLLAVANVTLLLLTKTT